MSSRRQRSIPLDGRYRHWCYTDHYGVLAITQPQEIAIKRDSCTLFLQCTVGVEEFYDVVLTNLLDKQQKILGTENLQVREFGDQMDMTNSNNGFIEWQQLVVGFFNYTVLIFFKIST